MKHTVAVPRGGVRALICGDLPMPDVEDALARMLVDPADALPVPSAADRVAWGASGTADPITRTLVTAEAEAERGTPWPQPLASGAARLHLDGDRDGWEQLAFARQRRLSRAAIAAATTADDRWLAEVLDGIWLLCEQSSWCWPAHDDAFARHGSVLPDVDTPFLDLGAGEVAGQLAWIDHLLGADLEARYPGVRARIRREVRLRVLGPFLHRRDWHWLGEPGDAHNWNPWIHGNVLVAALRLMDDPADAAERARIIALVVDGMDRYVTSLPADGAIDEGYAYWWNGACRALEALELLLHATRGGVDAFPLPALRETVAFPHRMHLGGAWYLNLADGQARPPAEQPWHALHRAATRVGDADAAAHAASHRRPGTPAASVHEGLGRLLMGMTDAAWLAATEAHAPLPAEVWLPSTQVLVARERAGSANGLTLAVKGGHNGENHNHNDVGSFVVAVDGVPVVVDAGRPTYTKDTFGPRRYDIWTMQSGWHNVPVIDGGEQLPGREHAASAVDVARDAAGVEMSLELSGAYRDADGWSRTARLDRAARTVTIRDVRATPRLGVTGSEVRMLVAGEMDLDDHGAVVRPLEGARAVRLRWNPKVTATATVRPLDDPLLTDVWGNRLTRIDLSLGDGTEATVTIELDHASTEDPR